MKKNIALMLALTMVVALLAGCGTEPAETTPAETTPLETTPVETTPAETTPAATTAAETTPAETTTEATTPAETTAATTSAPDPIETATLVACWEFDEIKNGMVTDLSGNGHFALVSGTPKIEAIDGGNAISLKTLGDHLQVADADDLDFTKEDDFTLTARVKWTGKFPDNWACIVNRGLMLSAKAYRYFGFWIDSASSIPQFGVTNASENGCLNVPAKQKLDTEWHTFTMIQNVKDHRLYFYIDGELQSATNLINANSNQPMFIGYNGNSGNQGQFDGLIDYIKIYKGVVEEGKEPMKEVKTVDDMERGTLIFTDELFPHTYELPYRVYYPTGYNANDNKTYPMLFFLHGHGEVGTDNEKQIRVLNAPNELLDLLIENDSCIIVAPQCQCSGSMDFDWISFGTGKNHVWSTASRDVLPENPTTAMRAAMKLLDQFLDSGKVDLSRVYAAGISMGGFGTWELISRRPETFAAAVPVCGAGFPTLAESLKDIAIWAFHGEADPTVPVKGTRDMETALKAVGGNMKATYFPGVGHESWISAYKTAGLVDWLLAQKK